MDADAPLYKQIVRESMGNDNAQLFESLVQSNDSNKYFVWLSNAYDILKEEFKLDKAELDAIETLREPPGVDQSRAVAVLIRSLYRSYLSLLAMTRLSLVPKISPEISYNATKIILKKCAVVQVTWFANIRPMSDNSIPYQVSVEDEIRFRDWRALVISDDIWANVVSAYMPVRPFLAFCLRGAYQVREDDQLVQTCKTQFDELMRWYDKHRNESHGDAKYFKQTLITMLILYYINNPEMAHYAPLLIEWIKQEFTRIPPLPTRGGLRPPEDDRVLLDFDTYTWLLLQLGTRLNLDEEDMTPEYVSLRDKVISLYNTTVFSNIRYCFAFWSLMNESVRGHHKFQFLWFHEAHDVFKTPLEHVDLENYVTSVLTPGDPMNDDVNDVKNVLVYLINQMQYYEFMNLRQSNQFVEKLYDDYLEREGMFESLS